MRSISKNISVNNLFRIPSFIFYFIKSFIIFKNPLSVIFNYIQKESPTDKRIELRNGLKIFLSNHPHDLTTVFLIFAKKEYRGVLKDSIVVDIGANIGAFSLLAAQMSAKKIYAYEPNQKAFIVLQKNILLNGLQHIIIPYRLALSSKENKMIKYPIESSPYNRELTDDDLDNSELVSTTTLESIMKNNMIDSIDLLKIDCEGCEYDVFFNSTESVISKIKNITMEYHEGLGGRGKDLIKYLGKYNFRVTCHKREAKVLWLSKS